MNTKTKESLESESWVWWQYLVVAFLIMAILFVIANNFFRVTKTKEPLGFKTLTIEQEIAGYKKQLSNSRNNYLVLAKLADTYIKQAKITGEPSWYLLAEQSAKESLVNEPKNNFYSLLILASINMAKHEFKNALELANEVKKNEKTRIHGLGIEFDAYFAMGETKKAQETLTKIEFELARVYSKIKGIKDYKSLDPVTLTRKALLLQLTGKDNEAEENFKLAINNSGNLIEIKAWTYTLYANFLSNLGRLKEAESEAKFALNFINNYHSATVQLAEIARQKEDWNSIITLLKPLNDKNPRTDLSIRLAQAYKELNNEKEFTDLLSKTEKQLLQEQNSGSFGHVRDYLKLLLMKKDSTSLKLAFEKVQEEKKIRKDFETLLLSAETEIYNNELDLAKNDLRTLISSNINNAKLFYLYGLLLEKKDKTKFNNEIKSYYNLALKTNPYFDKENIKQINIFLEKG